MASKNPTIKKSISTMKSFSYTNDEANLSFTLNVDNSKQIRAFKKLLEAALTEVTEYIEGMKN